jgi:hypothetical protein
LILHIILGQCQFYWIIELEGGAHFSFCVTHFNIKRG